MQNAILRDAEKKIARFNEIGLHYNIVGDEVHRVRSTPGTDPFGQVFQRYIVAGLISWDMMRGGMMGKSPYNKEVSGDRFASRLDRKLKGLRQALTPLMNLTLATASLPEHCSTIMAAYDALSLVQDGGLSQNGKAFHVGATKILHFLNPAFFIIIDSNASRAFRQVHLVPFRNGTQPGYSAENYLKCMRSAQKDILAYGRDEFQRLEPAIPITRIYDKLTFITGSGLKGKTQKPVG